MSIGYDFQGSYPATFGSIGDFAQENTSINNTQGFRVDLMYPVLSKNNILLTLNANYLQSNFSIDNIQNIDHPLPNVLQSNGLRSTSFSALVFKPLNIKNFLLIQAGLSMNGDYSFSNFQDAKFLRYFGAVIYGWKLNDRKMWGLGVTRTYLGGALNYLPVLYYQSSSKDGRWTVDAVLPSRFNIKRNFTKKRVLSAGFQFEGNTYTLNGFDQYLSPEEMSQIDAELRRSELRFRLVYDHAITNTLWFSVQAGYRYNWQFNVDNGDFFRSLFSDEPYLFENDLGNPLYGQVSISWVSP